MQTVRYGAGIIEWTKDKVKEMDQRSEGKVKERLLPCMVGYI